VHGWTSYPLATVRRLFSTFAHGPPGVGLLIMRLATGSALITQAIQALQAGPPLGFVLLHALSIALGLLLILGLWTPIAGALAALEALWSAFSFGHQWQWVLLAALAGALALIGPGAWSVDARLFGWKRLEIRDRKGQEPPPFE